jgi:ABC-type uncharacterized transport system substrate-binding protein
MSLLIAAHSADAHPHVFIDTKVAFVFTDGKVTSLRLRWVFDDIFSDDLLNQFDADGDGKFDKLESKKVADGVLPNLKLFHYFTYVWVDGKKLDPIVPSNFVASADSKRIVTFDMDTTLPTPVDPRKQALATEVYDHEFYVEVDLSEKDPVSLVNAQGMPCGASVRDDHENAYFGGFVVPQEIAIQCH